MPPPLSTSFDDVLDANPLSRFQVRVIVLCTLIAMIDGFDTQSIALAAPDIANSWRVDISAFGLVFGIGLLGGVVGAAILGRASDRFGRRPVLLVAIAAFAVFSLATPLVGSVTGLIVMRFLTGLGLGGALPIIVALTAEYAPRRMRATVVGLMFSGFSLGAVVGGVASAVLIPSFGWQIVFWVGGAVPLVLLPVLWAFLPESARYLGMRGDHGAVAGLLRQMGSTVPPGEIVPDPAESRSPVVRLFTDGRATGTLLLWATLFMSLLLSYLLLNWIPIVARTSGIGASAAILGVVALNLGAILGQLVIGRLADRRQRPTVVTGTAFALGAVAIATIGFTGSSAIGLLATAFVAGFLAIGAQLCTVALSSIFYETSLRGTGVGWAAGVGRIGGIVGPVLGGVILAVGASAPSLFGITAVAAVLAAVAAFAMAWLVRIHGRSVATASAQLQEPSATPSTRGLRPVR